MAYNDRWIIWGVGSFYPRQDGQIIVNRFYLFVTKKKQKRKTPCYGISQLHISYAVGCLLQIVRV